MADLNTTVRISGFVLGSLMFQHLNSDSDVEGFILGESIGEEKSNITDSQIDHIHFEHTINIQKHVSCRKRSNFYNNVGDVNPNEIRQILSNYKEENVVGWYRQRRNTDHQMTFREQVVHQNLRTVLSNQELIFLLLTPSDATVSGSTHRLEYSIYKSHGSQYQNIPVLVSNLGMLEQQDYWRVSTACSSLNHSQAVKNHRSKFLSSGEGVKEVEKVSDMNDTLLAELKTVCEHVEESERLAERLQAEVTALRKAISERKRQQEQFEIDGRSIADHPQENVLLCAAMRALFPNSPLLRTQALTQRGCPVPELCCSADHGIDISAKLPLILSYQHTQERKRRLGKWTRSHAKRHLTELPQTSKRKKRTTGDTEGSLSDSGSDTEEELTSQNGILDQSNSPVF